jgi:hypothetical protein
VYPMLTVSLDCPFQIAPSVSLTFIFPATFNWRACYKPGKWAMIYMGVEDIDIASLYDFHDQ